MIKIKYYNSRYASKIKQCEGSQGERENKDDHSHYRRLPYFAGF